MKGFFRILISAGAAGFVLIIFIVIIEPSPNESLPWWAYFVATFVGVVFNWMLSKIAEREENEDV